MEMNIYEKESFLHSISNLVMLKAFYDSGVDIKVFNVYDYMVDSMDPCFEILISGCTLVFDEFFHYSYDEAVELEGKYNDVFTDGIPEHLFIIKDQNISRVLHSKSAEELISYVKDIVFEFSDAEIKVCEETSEILILIYFHGLLHEVSLLLLEIHQKCIELINLIEEGSHAISDYIDRQTP